MKQIVWIALACCVSTTSLAQEDTKLMEPSKWQYGIRSGIYTTVYLNNLIYHAQFTAKKGIHEFAFGPSVGRTPYFHPYNSNTYDDAYKFNGVDIAYRIFPNGQGKIFDFYFQVDLLQKWGTGYFTDYISDYPNPNELTPDEVDIRSGASVMILEYGFDIKFLKHFYLGVSAGYGGKLEFRTLRYHTYEEFDFNETSFRFDYIARASLGYRF